LNTYNKFVGASSTHKIYQQQNRPYNVQTLIDNLHGAISKAPLKKILQSLVDEGKLTSKTFGKQIIYWRNQVIPLITL
jgi:hypothetical protein